MNLDKPSSEPGCNAVPALPGLVWLPPALPTGVRPEFGHAAVLHIGEVRLDAEAAEDPRQEVEEALVIDLDALDLRALAVRRPGNLDRPGRATIGELLVEDAVLNVVGEGLVECRDAELSDVAEIILERKIVLPRFRRLQIRIVGVGRVERIDPDGLSVGPEHPA